MPGKIIQPEAILTGAMLAATLLAAACSNGTGEGYLPVGLTIVDDSGNTPSGFVAVATFDDGEPRIAACGNLAAPGTDGGSDTGSLEKALGNEEKDTGNAGRETDSSDRIRCADDGVELNVALGDVHVVVKARGFRTTSIEIPEDVEAAAVPLTLVPAATPELNDDYATAVMAEDAQKVFATLGVKADTELGPAMALKFYIEDIQGSPVA